MTELCFCARRIASSSPFVHTRMVNSHFSALFSVRAHGEYSYTIFFNPNISLIWTLGMLKFRRQIDTINSPINSKFHTHTHTHTTVLRLYGFCPGQPGWAGTRSNIHPLTPIVVINRRLSASYIYYDPWHPPYSIHVLYSLFPQSLSKFSLVHLLAWHPALHTPYISSHNHCLLFDVYLNTVKNCIRQSSVINGANLDWLSFSIHLMCSWVFGQF